MQEEAAPSQFAELTAEVVSAYLANSNVPLAEVPALISKVHDALAGLGQPQIPAAQAPTPAVPIKKSVTPDYLISLEDGRQYKTLKRHLTRLGMTPGEYREKWGLPQTYPMVSATYAKTRSELALKIGLGQKRKKNGNGSSKGKPGRAKRSGSESAA